MSHSWLLFTEIPMKIRHFPYEMKYIIFLVGRVLSHCLLPSITLFDRMLTIGDTEAGYKVCDGVFSLNNSFSCLVEKCCHHPEWTGETRPSGQGTYSRCPFTYFGTIISNTMFLLASKSHLE